MKFGTLFIALLLAGSTAQAQIPTPTSEAGPWSLDDCIRYAHEHNIQIQQQALQVEQRSVELNTSRHSRLPDLGANLGTNFSFGRSLISNNTYADNNQVSGSPGVSASLPVFMGGRINHEIAAGKLSLKAAAQDLDRIREDVSVNIMSYYLDVLVAKELVDVAEQALALSTQQVERSREQVRTGKVAESVLYENEALLAADEYKLTQSRNDLSLSLLALSQALNRTSAEGFDIVAPTFDSLTVESMRHLRNPAEVLSYALDNRPRIQAERFRLEQALRAVRMSRAAYYPQITLTGGYGTNVYHSFATGAVNPAFGRQFRNNSTEYVGVAINIPIFNRMATRNSVRTAKLGVRSQQLVLTEAEQTLQKEIETAYYQADAALLKYRSAEKALNSAQGRLQVRSREIRCGPLDDLRLQRRQDPHAEGRIRPDPGQIRIHIPHQDPRFLRGFPPDALSAVNGTRRLRPQAVQERSSRKRKSFPGSFSCRCRFSLCRCFRATLLLSQAEKRGNPADSFRSLTPRSKDRRRRKLRSKPRPADRSWH